ncbi:MAG: hypothetical protein EBR60_08060 [Burkholderiaceae bacterium]|nr:hypothetical protein [Burkholderiaceae bacterium]
MFNLADYEPVEVRLEKFIKDYPAFRIATELEVVEATRYIVKAYLFKDAQDSVAWATGYAEEKVTDRGVNQTSALENCETSAIGRALANAGYAPKGKRPSREEMSKVVAKKPEKPAVADEQDYWSTPVGQYNKVVDAPVTLDKAIDYVTEILGTAEAIEAPSCEHGHMQWREGEKNGKAWGGYFCGFSGSTAHRCPTKWYTLGSDGRFQPQKAWA